MEFLLRCDFTPQRLPIKLSQFHQQVLLYWKLLYNHNFTPHKTPIWNNRYITIRNKSLYNKDWMEKGIWSVLHLVNSRGCFITFENFCLKYNIFCNRNTFNSIIKAIPNSILCLIKGFLSNSNPTTLCLPSLLIGGCDFKETTFPNKTIRNMFDNILFPTVVYRK